MTALWAAFAAAGYLVLVCVAGLDFIDGFDRGGPRRLPMWVSIVVLSPFLALAAVYAMAVAWWEGRK